MIIKIPKILIKPMISLLIASLVSCIILFSQSSETIPIAKIIGNMNHVVYDLNWKLKNLTRDISSPNDAQSKIQPLYYDDDRIYIIDIDDRALQELGSYNRWSRQTHSIIAQKLSEGGASAIVFDILFKEADHGRKLSSRVFDALRKMKPQLIPQLDSSNLAKAFDDDSALVQSVYDNPNIITSGTVGSALNYQSSSEVTNLSNQDRLNAIPLQSKLASTKGYPPMLQREILDDIFPELLIKSHHFGLANAYADSDGIHRSEPLMYAFPNPSIPISKGIKPQFIPTLGLATALHLMGYSMDHIKIEWGKWIEIGKPLGIYRDSLGHLQTTYPNLSYAMVQGIFDSAQTLRHWLEIMDTTNQSKTITVSTKVVVHRDSLDKLNVDILQGQTLSDSLLFQLLNWSDFDNPDYIHHLPINHKSYLFGWDNSSKMYFIKSNGDSCGLSTQTISALRENKSKIMRLAQRKSILLAGDLEFTLNRDKKGGIYSNYIILSPKVIRAILDQPQRNFDKIQKDTLRLGPTIQIPIDENGRLLINYVGPYINNAGQHSSFPTTSYYDFVSGDQDGNLLAYQGKIAILGSTAASLFDHVSTPVESDYPGPLIHANLIQNILTQNFLERISNETKLAILLSLVLIITLICIYLSPIISFSISSLLAAGLLISQFLLFSNGKILDSIDLFIGILFAMIGGLAGKYFLEEKERKKTVSIFKQYISPELIDQMLDSGETPQLGGVKNELSAFFTDIASFSTFSEQIGDPTRLVELLNEYLTGMTDILIDSKGTLDKYEGDAIIAFFGAPVTLENHAHAACLTALKMLRKLDEMRHKWAKDLNPKGGQKWPTIVQQMRMRIGINSGDIVTGNMGSTIRKNYTMMGDAVNLAARLESGAKQYGVYIMVSKFTAERAGSQFLFRFVDRVQVVGKNEAIEIYELLEEVHIASTELQQLQSLFQRAWNHYQNQEWDQAILDFESCLPWEPNHPDRSPGSKTCPSLVYIERCQKYRDLQFPENWDGIYRATEK